MYRVFDCAGFTTDDLIVAGISRAFIDGVDILSISLGAAGGWDETPTAVVLSRVVSRGVIAVIAAGNSAFLSVLTASDPAATSNVMAIASVENIANMGWPALTSRNQPIVWT